MFQDTLIALAPHITEIVLTIAIPFAALQFSRWTGVRIEEKHMRALHSAILTGVQSAIKDGAGAGANNVKASAIAYAKQSVPDAIRALVPGDTVLDRIAERYVMEQMQRLGH
jgi:hypothetical protein